MKLTLTKRTFVAIFLSILLTLPLNTVAYAEDIENTIETINNTILKLDNKLKTIEKELNTHQNKPKKAFSIEKQSKEEAFQKKENSSLSQKVKIQKENNGIYEIGSIYINNKNVISFKSSIGQLSAYERALAVGKRLDDILNKNPSMLEKLTPTRKGASNIATINEKVIFFVDDQTAERTNMATPLLTLAWVNNIRKAVGLKEIPRVLSPIASRGFSGRSNRNVVNLAKNTGIASWYGGKFHGRRCANGSIYNMYQMTAAHKKLPFGTQVKVTNLRNNKSCIVKITDRGPFIHGRIIDLSKAAAKKIGMLGSGTAQVKIEIMN